MEELVTVDLLIEELREARDGLSRAQVVEVLARLSVAGDALSEAVSTLE